MEKLRLNYDKNSVINKLNETRDNPNLRAFDVTLDNLNDCLVYLKEKGICQNCKGLDQCVNTYKGHHHIIKDDEIVLVKCNKMNNMLIRHNSNRYIKTLYLPENILNASLVDFRIDTENRRNALKEAINFINEYDQNNFRKGLTIRGKFGSGKTYLLAAIARSLSEKNINTLLIYFPDLVFELKNSFSNPDKLNNIINMLKEVDVLMLDDLGSENLTPWLRDEILSSVINYRFSSNKPIFISTNLDYSQLINHLSIDNGQVKAARIINKLNSISKDIIL